MENRRDLERLLALMSDKQGLGVIHVSGATSVAERHRTWLLLHLGEDRTSQSNALSWATPVK